MKHNLSSTIILILFGIANHSSERLTAAAELKREKIDG